MVTKKIPGRNRITVAICIDPYIWKQLQWFVPYNKSVSNTLEELGARFVLFQAQTRAEEIQYDSLKLAQHRYMCERLALNWDDVARHLPASCQTITPIAPEIGTRTPAKLEGSA